MILALLLAQAATIATRPPAAPPPKLSAEQVKYEACVEAIGADPAKAAKDAEEWRIAGGDLLARQCLGLAFAAQERWGPAAVAFEQAAAEAELRRDGRAAALWVQAGNAALAGEDPARARTAFDRALALPVMSDEMRGETYLDRARAGVAISDLVSARADLDKAIGLVPRDPMAWLLSASLALRQRDLPRAKAHVAEAARLAPNEAPVAYEQGNVAEALGDTAGARIAWERAVGLDPESPAGQAARLRLSGAGVRGGRPDGASGKSGNGAANEGAVVEPSSSPAK